MDWVGISALAALWATVVTSHTLLRRELKGDIRDLRDDLKGDIKALDDRLFLLSTGLKPLIEQAQRTEAS